MRNRELLARVRERREALRLQMTQLMAQDAELDRVEKLLVMRPKAAADNRVAERAEQLIVQNSNPTP